MTAPMVAPSLAPLHAAVLAALRSRIPRVGDMGAPEGDPPYAFLSRTDTRWSGSLANPHEMVTAVFQVQCVALDSAGVDWLEHRARLALALPPVAEGWLVLRYLPPDGPGGIRVDRDVTPHLAFSTPEWRVTAQPGSPYTSAFTSTFA